MAFSQEVALFGHFVRFRNVAGFFARESPRFPKISRGGNSGVGTPG